jgi:hypothetical protein
LPYRSTNWLRLKVAFLEQKDENVRLGLFTSQWAHAYWGNIMTYIEAELTVPIDMPKPHR